MASILLVGAGIIDFAIVLTRTPPPSEVSPQGPIAKVEPSDDTDTAAEDKPAESKAAKGTDAADDTRRQEFIRLMIEGGTSFNAQKLDEAVSALSEAARLFPDDADAKAKLAEAETALTKLNQAKQDASKLREDAARLVKQGQDALEQKKYAAAVEFFKLALQKDSADSTATTGLVAAQEAQNKSQLDEKKLAEYETYIAGGKAAPRAGATPTPSATSSPPSAWCPMTPSPCSSSARRRSNSRACRTGPTSRRSSARLLDLANGSLRLEEIRGGGEDVPAGVAGHAAGRRRKKGLAEAQTALKWRGPSTPPGCCAATQPAGARFADAALAFREALRALPDDETADRALRRTEILQENQNVYFRGWNGPRAAMTLKQYADAIVAYNEALRGGRRRRGPAGAAEHAAAVRRGPAQAQGLRKARRRRSTLLKAAKYSQAGGRAPRRPPGDAAPPAGEPCRAAGALRDAMSDGLQALGSRRFQEAIQHFQAALMEYPNDFAARNYLTKARSGAKSAS